MAYLHASDPASFHIDCTRNPCDSQLLPIFVLFSGDFGSTSTPSPEDQLVNETCATAFSELRRTFALPYATGFSLEFGDAVAFWTMHQSPEFFDLLKEDNPKALVVLAFYCVLLQRSENNWYVEGHGRKLLAEICRRLERGWENWIIWPLHELGFENDDPCQKLQSPTNNHHRGVETERTRQKLRCHQLVITAT